MSQNNITKKQLVADIIREFPEEPNRGVARIAYNHYPDAFSSLENAREVVRYVRGARGQKMLKNCVPDLKKPLGWQLNLMPKSQVVPRQDVVISGKHKALILSDIHIPYHDETALNAAIEYGKKQKPTILILNGDIGDFYSISRHDKDPRRVLADEIDAVRQFLFWVRKQFPKIRILFKIGNHEDRLERFMAKKAPELLGTTDFEIPSLLKLDDIGIETVGSLNLIRLGNLPIYHGHELPQGMSSPVNPARGIWMRSKSTLLCGHWHRTSEHTESTGLDKHFISCWSTGCLCELKPAWLSCNSWNHGFAMVETEEDGSFEVHNHKIIKGRVY